MKLNPKDGLTVEIEDHGQDFLRFHIKDQKIVETLPFQGAVWDGREVMNTTLSKGDVIYLKGAKPSEIIALKYKVTRIRMLPHRLRDSI